MLVITGLPFATNFNPEINLRELDQPGKFYKDGSWKEIPALSMKKTFDFPEAGEKEMYVVYHEELETITKHIPEIKQARFWMTFGQSYINHLNAFKNVGFPKLCCQKARFFNVLLCFAKNPGFYKFVLTKSLLSQFYLLKSLVFPIFCTLIL